MTLASYQSENYVFILQLMWTKFCIGLGLGYIAGFGCGLELGPFVLVIRKGIREDEAQ